MTSFSTAPYRPGGPGRLIPDLRAEAGSRAGHSRSLGPLPGWALGLLLAWSALLLLGCGTPAEPGASASTVGSPRGESESQTAAPMRVYFDLAAYPERAEQRRGRTLWIDLGASGGAKYTLGGWRTRTGRPVDVGEKRALSFGSVGELIVPAEGAGAASLVFAATAFFPDARLSVHVGGQRVGYLRIPSDGKLEPQRVEVAPGILRKGDNILLFRAESGRGKAIRTLGERAFAIGWLALQPQGEPVADERRGPPIARVERGEKESVMAIDAGDSLGFTFRVPAKGRLRARLRGAATEGQESRPIATNDRPNVTIHRDDQKPTPMANGAAGEVLDVDLGELAGELVRLEIAAPTAVELIDPAILVPNAAERGRGDREEARPVRRPRNVLVYLIDTLRADRLRPYEPKTRVETPGFDRYVGGASLFEHGLSQENWTKPSVATLLSGLLPWQHRAMDGEAVLPSSVAILPEILQKKGFQTAGFVCNGYVSKPFGFERGWDRFKNYIKEGQRTQARFVANDVLAWLDERDPSKPFFLYVHTIDPHVPYIPPPEILERYDPEPYAGPVDFTRDRQLLEKVKGKRLRLNERDRKRLVALYEGEISYHDVHMAAILDGLDRRGLSESTLVVITSDHGEELFDHDSVGHGHSLYQELLRVPFVIRIPGETTAVSRISTSVGLVDIAPTIAEALGIELPEDVAGRSLLPLIRGADEDAPRVTVAGSNDGWRAVVVDELKLIQRTYEATQVFDLRSDPREMHDIAADRPIALRYLRAQLGLAIEHAQADRHEAQATRVDAATEAALRALGYVGASKQ